MFEGLKMLQGLNDRAARMEGARRMAEQNRYGMSALEQRAAHRAAATVPGWDDGVTFTYEGETFYVYAEWDDVKRTSYACARLQ